MIKFQEASNHQIAYSKVNYNLKSELFEYLQASGINLADLSKIKNSKRQIEWMTIRQLLLKIYPDFGDIVYDVHGKPHFTQSNQHVSISHSHEMVALAINKDQITGIDIQLINDQIVRIKDKFLSESEQTHTSTDAIELSYYWSCKEALFKIYGKKDGFLKANFFIDEIQFDEKGGIAKGRIKINHHESIHHLKMRRIDNYVMAYVVNS